MLLLLLLAFTFGFVGSMPLAGPIAILVVSRCAERKYGEALRLALGASISEGAYAAIAFFGFATFLARHPLILPISRAVTAVVLVGLGIHFVLWKQTPQAQKAPKKSSHAGAFFFGLTVMALNPTLLATWSAAVAALYARQIVEMRAWMAPPFGLCAGAGVALWFSLLVWLLRRYQKRFNPGMLAWVIRAMGVLLIVIGLYSGFEFVRYLRAAPHAPASS